MSDESAAAARLADEVIERMQPLVSGMAEGERIEALALLRAVALHDAEEILEEFDASPQISELIFERIRDRAGLDAGDPAARAAALRAYALSRRLDGLAAQAFALAKEAARGEGTGRGERARALRGELEAVRPAIEVAAQRADLERRYADAMLDLNYAEHDGKTPASLRLNEYLRGLGREAGGAP